MSPWGTFTLDKAVISNPYPGPEAGLFWQPPQSSGGNAWYPPTGWRGELKINSTGASAHYLSSTPKENRVYGFYFNNGTTRPFYYTISRSSGHSVRCIRE